MITKVKFIPGKKLTEREGFLNYTSWNYALSLLKYFCRNSKRTSLQRIATQ
jgi:hypothetical protein